MVPALPRPLCPVVAELLAIVAALERLEAERRYRVTCGGPDAAQAVGLAGAPWTGDDGPAA